jgi:DnaJ-class molecular chaperone
VDGPENGPAPGAWDVAVTQPALFENHTAHYRVPHTSRVEVCHTCRGRGEVSCGTCGGDGRVSCGTCDGDGRVSRTRTITRTDAQGNSRFETEHYTESC